MARPLLAVYALLLAVSVLAPSSQVQSGLVVKVAHVMIDLGVPAQWVIFSRAEIVANALIVAPLAMLGSVVFPRSRWQDWTAWTFLGASLVELIQGLLLPARQARLSDIVANTAGAAIGALVVAAIRRLVRRQGQAGEQSGGMGR